ncbi:class I SAM-dependent methyltransferase [Candidatus Uabimicrobium amorphum]|uniref:Methyltransferase type 11 domain-containing protein n=1 Tax=Uabimicrobium amorphum TaxID=2596890 RepID=A0A5S9F5Q4_UABAM|nr:class I SAM-dependent methyltransferase [Candidatus Uabimicrobium amorphum]BBM85512.1 hypothetical protein UABAM_03881 [Candidatus Uabimicrobium amorphum]
MDIVHHNSGAWDQQSKQGSRWSQPVTSKEIEAARNGEWNVILTPNKNVPHCWFDSLPGKNLLGLASGGGQQIPILSAAGARVTSFDNSQEQLDKDQNVAQQNSLEIKCIRGDMANLSVFADNHFDIIFHPVSNVFVQDLRPVWQECFRVLKNGGRLLSGFMNPSFFLFDHSHADKTGELKVRFRLPFSDIDDLSEQEVQSLVDKNVPLEFGHTLEQQIGGQLQAGFLLKDFYEDDWDDESTPLNKYTTTTIATLAIKLL